MIICNGKVQVVHGFVKKSKKEAYESFNIQVFYFMILVHLFVGINLNFYNGYSKNFDMGCSNMYLYHRYNIGYYVKFNEDIKNTNIR